MARTPVEERLEKMREDERKLRERRKALEARVSTERRKAETRERIMLGAFRRSSGGQHEYVRQLWTRDGDSDKIA